MGAGAAGLITAHTLIQDGFKDVQVLEKGRSPGGVFSADKSYPGLSINKCVIRWLQNCVVSDYVV